MKENFNSLQNMQTPETPRAKGSGFNTLKESVEKAKKYDELIKQIIKDRAYISRDLAAYKEQSSALKIGYVNGYVDGKIAVYDVMLNIYFDKYLDGINQEAQCQL